MWPSTAGLEIFTSVQTEFTANSRRPKPHFLAVRLNLLCLFPVSALTTFISSSESRLKKTKELIDPGSRHILPALNCSRTAISVLWPLMNTTAWYQKQQIAAYCSLQNYWAQLSSQTSHHGYGDVPCTASFLEPSWCPPQHGAHCIHLRAGWCTSEFNITARNQLALGGDCTPLCFSFPPAHSFLPYRQAEKNNFQLEDIQTWLRAQEHIRSLI